MLPEDHQAALSLLIPKRSAQADPDNASRKLLAVFRDGEVRLADETRSGDRVLRAISREAPFLKNVRLPRGVQPYKSVAALLWRMNEESLSACLDLDVDHRFLLAYFVLSTWFIDCERVPVAP